MWPEEAGRTAGSFMGARFLSVLGAVLLVLAAGIIVKTMADLRPLPETLTLDASDVRKVQILDRHGAPLTVTYENRWNIHDYARLHDIPLILQSAFIHAEDKRFYDHDGVDWLARGNALYQNLKTFSSVRGASTITEQVVRMLHPRPRTVWSRWLEGIEAGRLEERFSKADILEFYLNQVPYAARRRGVSQAAHYYFDRDLDTLSMKEMLSLSVLVRAPGRMDLRNGAGLIERPLSRLAWRLKESGVISADDASAVAEERLVLASPGLSVQASHFVNHVYASGLDARQSRGRLHTTLDSSLQHRLQKILDGRMEDLKARDVSDGAVLVVDHFTNEVLAWVNDGGGGFSEDDPGSHIDRVTTPRQPGSTLKPLLYAFAIEKGWTAATLIDDSPVSSAVGTGLHTYRNYSRLNYGLLRLRDALGNSLNIPAVRAVQFVGVENFHRRLRLLGVESLTRHPAYYGEGLALGNGEVTLYELVGAYASLARKGVFRPLELVRGEAGPTVNERRVFSEESASIIADILSDPEARLLEFGNGNLLRFPAQTAVKTGTSTDYRDAWAVGFSHRYTAGVWMGNVDSRPMREVTGSIGPALVLRAVFAELNRNREARALYLSPGLTSARICRVSGLRSSERCPSMDEWFEEGRVPEKNCGLSHQDVEDDGSDDGAGDVPGKGLLTVRGKAGGKRVRLIKPTHGLRLAMDPRIPDDLEAFPLEIGGDVRAVKVEWIMDGDVVGSTGADTSEFLWRLSRGTHTTMARVWPAGGDGPVETRAVTFHVK